MLGPLENKLQLRRREKTLKHYILKAEQSLLDGVYTEAYITKFVNYHHCHKNKGFLKKKERVKGFSILMTMFYHSSKLNLTIQWERALQPRLYY